MQRCLNALWVSVGFLSLAMNAGCGQVMTSDEIHGSAAVSPAVARDAAPSRQSATVESDERVVTRASTAIVGKTQLDPSAPEPDIAARLTSEELIATGLLPLFLADSEPTPHLPEPEEVSLGDDLTRPLRRLDSRIQYEDIKGGNDRYISTTRFERPFTLSDHWRLSTRADFLVITGNDAFSSKAESGYYTGLGDVLAQVALVNKIDDRWTWAFGSQMIFPTATEKQFGNGKYQAVPSAGVRYTLPEISRGSYCSALVRYDVDYAGRHDRSDISILEFGPELNIKLPRDFYIDFYPDSDIRYNCLTQKWFVPIDFQIGKRISPAVIASLETSLGVIRDYDYYKFKIEFRIGVFY